MNAMNGYERRKVVLSPKKVNVAELDMKTAKIELISWLLWSEEVYNCFYLESHVSFATNEAFLESSSLLNWICAWQRRLDCFSR